MLCITEPWTEFDKGEDGKGHAVLYWVDAHSGHVTFRLLTRGSGRSGLKRRVHNVFSTSLSFGAVPVVVTFLGSFSE